MMSDEKRKPEEKAGQDLPAAGPHDKKSLQDNSKTPGAGTLPDDKEQDVNPGAG